MASWIKVYVHRLCRFEQYNAKKQEMVAAECPQGVVNGLLANAVHTRMPRLTAVRNVPTMDAEGRLIAMPGYDEKSGLLLISEHFAKWPAIRQAPSKSDLEVALQTLWKPFEQFPYVAAADKSVALGAALTAAVRCWLRTAPGFRFSATAPGTGKTLLAQCIGALYDGTAPAVSAPITYEEEWAKSLFSSALAGAGTLLFDMPNMPSNRRACMRSPRPRPLRGAFSASRARPRLNTACWCWPPGTGCKWSGT